MATRPRSALAGDPWRAFEALPPEVRAALRESLVDWCPLRAHEWHRELLRDEGLRPAQAIEFLVQSIRRLDQAEVAAFARRWPRGAAAYPHLAAEATLQRYEGPAGMPPPRPVSLPAKREQAPAPKRPLPGRRGAANPERRGAANPKRREAANPKRREAATPKRGKPGAPARPKHPQAAKPKRAKGKRRR